MCCGWVFGFPCGIPEQMPVVLWYSWMVYTVASSRYWESVCVGWGWISTIQTTLARGRSAPLLMHAHTTTDNVLLTSNDMKHSYYARRSLFPLLEYLPLLFILASSKILLPIKCNPTHHTLSLQPHSFLLTPIHTPSPTWLSYITHVYTQRQKPQ